MPICTSFTTNFTDLSRVQQNVTQYHGNATEYDWLVTTGMLVPSSDGVRLTLNETNAGTEISSTRYIHYGTVTFVLEASKWPGVVTAAITMSDVKDEIDLEWPGNSTFSVQSNYWFLGYADYNATEGQSDSVNGSTSDQFHTYTIDWQEQSLRWLVDGNVVRTVNKNDTLSDGQYKYPSTPSRIQASIWPSGINTSAPGTVTWGGGMINWQDPDYLATGYYFNTIQSISVTCAADPNQTQMTTGWVYGPNGSSGIPTVEDTTLATSFNSAEHSGIPGLLLAVAVLGGGVAALL